MLKTKEVPMGEKKPLLKLRKMRRSNTNVLKKKETLGVLTISNITGLLMKTTVYAM